MNALDVLGYFAVGYAGGLIVVAVERFWFSRRYVVNGQDSTASPVPRDVMMPAKEPGCIRVTSPLQWQCHLPLGERCDQPGSGVMTRVLAFIFTRRPSGLARWLAINRSGLHR